MIAARGAIAVGIRLFKKPAYTGPTPEEIVKELLDFDKSGDGQLSQDEVPERMQGLFTRGDDNHDGVLSRAELFKLAEAQSEASRRDERREQGKGERR